MYLVALTCLAAVLGAVRSLQDHETGKEKDITFKGDIVYRRMGLLELQGPGAPVLVSLHFKGATDFITRVKPSLESLGTAVSKPVVYTVAHDREAEGPGINGGQGNHSEPDGYDPYNPTFQLITDVEMVSWMEARVICEARGMRLPEVYTSTERDALSTFMQAKGIETCFAGLQMDFMSGFFRFESTGLPIWKGFHDQTYNTRYPELASDLDEYMEKLNVEFMYNSSGFLQHHVMGQEAPAYHGLDQIGKYYHKTVVASIFEFKARVVCAGAYSGNAYTWLYYDSARRSHLRKLGVFTYTPGPRGAYEESAVEANAVTTAPMGHKWSQYSAKEPIRRRRPPQQTRAMPYLSQTWDKGLEVARQTLSQLVEQTLEAGEQLSAAMAARGYCQQQGEGLVNIPTECGPDECQRARERLRVRWRHQEGAVPEEAVTICRDEEVVIPKVLHEVNLTLCPHLDWRSEARLRDISEAVGLHYPAYRPAFGPLLNAAVAEVGDLRRGLVVCSGQLSRWQPDRDLAPEDARWLLASDQGELVQKLSQVRGPEWDMDWSKITGVPLLDAGQRKVRWLLKVGTVARDGWQLYKLHALPRLSAEGTTEAPRLHHEWALVDKTASKFVELPARVAEVCEAGPCQVSLETKPMNSEVCGIPQLYGYQVEACMACPTGRSSIWMKPAQRGRFIYRQLTNLTLIRVCSTDGKRVQVGGLGMEGVLEVPRGCEVTFHDGQGQVAGVTEDSVSLSSWGSRPEPHECQPADADPRGPGEDLEARMSSKMRTIEDITRLFAKREGWWQIALAVVGLLLLSLWVAMEWRFRIISCRITAIKTLVPDPPLAMASMRRTGVEMHSYGSVGRGRRTRSTPSSPARGPVVDWGQKLGRWPPLTPNQLGPAKPRYEEGDEPVEIYGGIGQVPPSMNIIDNPVGAMERLRGIEYVDDVLRR